MREITLTITYLNGKKVEEIYSCENNLSLKNIIKSIKEFYKDDIFLHVDMIHPIKQKIK